MKLTSELWLDQLLTQFLPGFDHEREALGPPLLDARLHPMRADGVHDQGPSRHTGARGAEPPRRPVFQGPPIQTTSNDRI
jgi:hypothetical protein